MNGLQRAVFDAVYASREQRRRRRLAALYLYGRHFLHGLMLTWPFFLLLGAGLFHADSVLFYLLLAFLVPGLLGWLLIYGKGARRDYERLVRGRILHKGYLRSLH